MSNARNDYARLLGAQMTPIQMLDEITALRAALDQERADNERLRAFAQSSLYVAQSGRGDMGLLVEYHRHGLLDDKGKPTALLSGRGECGG